MKLNKIAIAITIAIGSLALSGCSATSALTGLIGSKPDVTAQVGAENVKQTVGLTAKQEVKNETAIEKSNVGKVDSSTRKTESIKAGTIQAERIEVNNNEPSVLWFGAGFILAWLICAGILYFAKMRENNKGA